MSKGYGQKDKRISFMDTDKRNADLMIRLKHDGLTKTKFFRAILTGYLERDTNIVEFITDTKLKNGYQSQAKAKIVEKLENEGAIRKSKLGLDNTEIENIFDILEKEHPDL